MNEKGSVRVSERGGERESRRDCVRTCEGEREGKVFALITTFVKIFNVGKIIECLYLYGVYLLYIHLK